MVTCCNIYASLLPHCVIAAVLVNLCGVRAADNSLVSFHANASTSAEYYSLANDGYSMYPRRPANLYRLMASAELQIGELSLPLSLLISSQQTNYSTAVALNQSFAQFLQNPLNVIALEPRWKWIQLHAGSYTPRWSELSVGDVQIFGVGAELNPAFFRLGFFSGVSQRAVNAYSTGSGLVVSEGGAYKRSLTGAKIGFGSEASSFVDLSVVRMIDDTNSVSSISQFTLPQESIVASLNSRITLDTGITLSAELAGNLFTRNLRSELTTSSDIPKLPLFTPRISTRVGTAYGLMFNITKNSYGLVLRARYLSDGFISPGFPNMQPDRAEFSLAPRVVLGDVRINANASFRFNNVQNTSPSRLYQLSAALNSTVKLSKEFFAAASLTNVMVRNNESNDAFRIENTSRSVSVTPTYMVESSAAFSTVSITATYFRFTNGVATQFLSTSNTFSVVGSYMTSLKSIPLSANATLNYLNNTMPLASLKQLGLNLSGSYRLLNDKLTPGIRFTLQRSESPAFDTNTQTLLGLICSWRISTLLTLSTDLSTNTHTFSKGSYRENFAQSTLSMQF